MAKAKPAVEKLKEVSKQAVKATKEQSKASFAKNVAKKVQEQKLSAVISAVSRQKKKSSN